MFQITNWEYLEHNYWTNYWFYRFFQHKFQITDGVFLKAASLCVTIYLLAKSWKSSGIYIYIVISLCEWLATTMCGASTCQTELRCFLEVVKLAVIVMQYPSVYQITTLHVYDMYVYIHIMIHDVFIMYVYIYILYIYSCIYIYVYVCMWHHIQFWSGNRIQSLRPNITYPSETLRFCCSPFHRSENYITEHLAPH